MIKNERNLPLDEDITYDAQNQHPTYAIQSGVITATSCVVSRNKLELLKERMI